jgi:molybdopterin/thiamine biosynthesis adenylyltransferase/nitroreductase
VRRYNLAVTSRSLLDRVHLMAAESIEQGAEPQPAFFDLSSDDGRRALTALLESPSPPRFVHDEIADQIGELLEARDPTYKPKGADRTARIDRHLASLGVPVGEYGLWVLYPWSSRLVHVLPRDEYRTVRTARNRYKITQPEQDTLYAKRIGVLGLSVGNSAAITFALEGIGGSFKVADFDLLSLSNMNRLRSGAPDIGVNKTVLAAREMFEIDPYLDITRYPRGVTAENMDDFLLGGGKLDLLVEECDDLYVKLVIRERCKALGIPVIMDTSDRGLLDVERFDREPDRPIMHGLIGDVSAESLKGLPTKDKVPIFLAIVGGHRMSPRMAASLPEIDQTIGSWPQLASAVALGGAITADAARRLLLGSFTESGRWYVDVESIARNGTGELTHGAEPPRPFEIAPEARAPRAIAAEPRTDGRVDRDTVKWLVANAILAPSAHNGQPWTFVWRDDALELRHDPAHDLPSLDYDRCATWAAFGAAAHNIELAARSIGLEPTFSHFPNARDEGLVSVVRFARVESVRDALLEHLPRRVTNRRRDGRHPIAPASLDELGGAAMEAGASLQLATSDAALDELAALMGACDRISNMNQAIHREVMDGFRWSRDEVESHRDGLDLATMELTASERAGMWLLSKWEIMDTLKRIGGGVALEDLAKKCVASTSAIGLLTTRGVAPADYLRGGHALQRVWLTATKLGVALQPWTGLPYLFARVERGAGAGLSPAEIAELRTLRERYRRVFDVRDGDAEVLLFRLSIADAPSAISLRRPVERVLTFA